MKVNRRKIERDEKKLSPLSAILIAAIYITFMWRPHILKGGYYQEYSMKYIYSTSQMSKLSLTLCTFSINSLVASLFLILLS